MAKRKGDGVNRRTAIVTYLGVEGACAAAVALLSHPEAGIFPTSAYGVHHTLSVVKDGAFAEVVICGVGVKCSLAEVIAPLSAMRAAGTRVSWYCAGGLSGRVRRGAEEIRAVSFRGEQPVAAPPPDRSSRSARNCGCPAAHDSCCVRGAGPHEGCAFGDG